MSFLLSVPVSAEKQRIAKKVASVLKLSVEIDTSSSERLVRYQSGQHLSISVPFFIKLRNTNKNVTCDVCLLYC